jgi:hypothetical protein
MKYNHVAYRSTYLGTKIDQLGDNTTEIKHRISQTIQAIHELNSIWWHNNITKNRKLYIYQSIIQSILMYGAEVWQISTREINFFLQKWMCYGGHQEKSRRERIKNEHIKEIMGVKGKADITDIIEKKRLQWYGHVKRVPGEGIPKLIMEWIPEESRKRGHPRKAWMEGLEAAMISRNLEQDQWRNREEWRSVSGRRRQLL